MKIIISLLTASLLYNAAAYSQTDYTQWLTNTNIDDQPISVLRIPDKDADPKIQPYTNTAQWQLDRNRKFLDEGRPVEFGMRGQVEATFFHILKAEKSFPVQYYRDEMNALYSADSARHKMKSDANLAKVQAYNDSIRIVQLQDGYYWINPDTVTVLSKPDKKSIAIGKLHRLSYVRAYEVAGKDDWVEVQFANHAGYILRKDLATDWEELNATDDELDELKSGRYFSFDPTMAYQKKLDRETAAEERSMAAANDTPKRNLIRGPRGGCYYINAHGNKQYVDRSLCK